MPIKVTDPAVLAALNGGAAPSAPAGPVLGPPPKPPAQPNPVEQERLRLAQEAADRASASEQRAQAEFEGTGGTGTVDEKKIATLLTRIAGGASDISGIARDAPEAQSPGFVESARGDLMPGGIGGMVSRGVAGPKRRAVHDAQRDMLDAALTLGTGAAYNAEQLSGQMASYFPQYGDSDDEIAIKNQRLARLIEAAKANAGPAWARVEPAIAPLMEQLGGAVNAPAGNEGGGNPWTAQQSVEKWGEELFDENGNPLGPDGGGAYDARGNYLGLAGNVTYEGETEDQRAARELADRREERLDESDAARVARQGVTLGLSDEAAGVGTALGRALTGDFNLVKNFNTGRDADNILNDRARNRLGWGGTALEVVSGGAGIRAGGNALLSAARSVYASGAPVTRGAIQNSLTWRATGEGALAGAIGGVGYGRDLEDKAVMAGAGAAGGALLGNVAQRIGNASANGARGRLAAGGDIQQAADDLDISVIPAVTGGTTARRLTSGARQGYISDRPIAAAVDKMEAGGKAARNRIAARTGTVREGDEAGELIRKGAEVYSKRTSGIGGKLYTRADRKAGGEKLALPTAIKAADDEMAQLAKGPGGTASELYKDLARLRKQMASGKFEVDGIRAYRTTLRNELTARGLRGSPQDAAYNKLLTAAEDDMIGGLIAAGKPEAAAALKTAAAFWRKRVETIDNVLEPVLGKNAPKSGEQIVTALEAMASPKSGNAARLRQLFQAMPKDEASSVAATLISRMGRPTPGAANADGFSFDTFLTNYNKLSPKARAAFFPPEVRESLGKLATVAQGVKQAGGAMNASNTAGALTAQAAFSAAPFWVMEPLSAISVTGAQYMAGKLLASPRVARWIASAPRNASPQAQRAYVAKLGGIAKAEPAIANEIGVFQRSFANDNVGTAAAAGNAEEDKRNQ